MEARKMLRLGIALICLALVLELLPAMTPSSLWLSTRWFEQTIDAHSGMLVPVPYRAAKDEPSARELTEMAEKYGIVPVEVGDEVSVRDLLQPGSSSPYGQAVWKRWPNVAARLGYLKVVDTRAKMLRRFGGLVFLAGLAFLFGALYHTYQAEKDIPSLHLP